MKSETLKRAAELLKSGIQGTPEDKSDAILISEMLLIAVDKDTE